MDALLFTKAFLYTISVVKANHAQDRAATGCTKGEKCFYGYPEGTMGIWVYYLTCKIVKICRCKQLSHRINNEPF